MFGYPLVLMCDVHATIDCIRCIENETNPRELYYDIWLDEINLWGPNRVIHSKAQILSFYENSYLVYVPVK